jgi:hypothetical protein
LIQVSVSGDGNHVWGVNAKDEIYYSRAGFSGSWERMAGGLKHVFVSDDGNHVWGVNTHDKVYYRAAGRSAFKWTGVDGALIQVSNWQFPRLSCGKFVDLNIFMSSLPCMLPGTAHNAFC